MLNNISVLSNFKSQLAKDLIWNFLSFKIVFAQLVFLKRKYFHYLGFLVVLDAVDSICILVNNSNNNLSLNASLK